MMLPVTFLSKLKHFVEAVWTCIHSPNSLSEVKEVEFMAHEIPIDVAFAILSKLPLKSLKRFICVHKSWTCLLENPYFMNMFRTNYLSKYHYDYNSAHLLLPSRDHEFYGSPNELYLLLGDKFENLFKLNWPRPLKENHKSWRIFGSDIHGTLLLHNYKEFILWMPASKQFRIIPPPNSRTNQSRWDVTYDSLRFGYDPASDDLKVIRHLKCNPHHLRCWEIYSLNRNSWRNLDFREYIHLDPVGDDIYINGLCHWLGITDTYDAKTYLVSFNLRYEFFRTTHLPLDEEGSLVPKCLMTLNGSIALISEYAETRTFVIWILGELRVKESWTKVFIIGPLPEVHGPIGGGKNGDIFFEKKNGDLVLFDLSTQTLKGVVAKWELHIGRIIVYRNNILPRVSLSLKLFDQKKKSLKLFTH